MPQLIGYKWLTNYGVGLIGNNQREVVKGMVKDTINLAAQVKFDTEDNERAFLLTTLRNKCYDYLRLNQSLTESV